MDTRKLPNASTRIRNARSLIVEYGMECWPEVENLAEAEYLIHGPLFYDDGLWESVPFEQFNAAGFNKAFHPMRIPTKEHLLLRRVKQLRHRYFKNIPDGFRQIDARYLGISRKIAACYGQAFEAIMFAALVSLRARNFTPEGVAVILDLLEPAELPLLKSDFRAICYKFRGLHEVRQFYELLRLLSAKTAALRR